MRILSAEFARKFKKEKRLCPGDYDFNNNIYPALKERPRFSQVVGLIDSINCGVSNKVFSESYTNHYFIHCNTLNDGLVAAVAICNMIYNKYTYEIGDYLVDMSDCDYSGPALGNINVRMIPPVFNNNNYRNDDYESDFYDDDECNPAIFLYDQASINDIFAFDTAGIRVCFVIYSEDSVTNISEIIPIFPTLQNLSPEQAAEQLHYTYISIPADKSDEIAGVIVDQISKSGFSCDGVKREVKALSQHPLITDEYKAVAAAKHVINNHIQRFSSIEYMLPTDFCDYIQPQTAPKKISVQTRLVGLEKELGIIGGAVNSLAFDIERKNKGLTDDISGCNMIFSGQPGTAKTTTAREFAKILAEKSIIPGMGNFRECRKSDIVGQFVGHTAKKVDDMFQELARKGGGVIFFDEIYTLSEKNSTCYDTEAINCITQNMENFRSKVFCIFAGYENKMKEFIDANPGLSSRISTTVRFSPYDDETLCKIFDSIVKTDKFSIIGDCHDTVKNFFTKLRELRGENFGNGREARNLFENTKRFTANRVMSQKKATKQMLSIITSDDITSAVNEILESVITSETSKMNTIGF